MKLRKDIHLKWYSNVIFIASVSGQILLGILFVSIFVMWVSFFSWYVKRKLLHFFISSNHPAFNSMRRFYNKPKKNRRLLFWKNNRNFIKSNKGRIDFY